VLLCANFPTQRNILPMPISFFFTLCHIDSRLGHTVEELHIRNTFLLCLVIGLIHFVPAAPGSCNEIQYYQCPLHLILSSILLFTRVDLFYKACYILSMKLSGNWNVDGKHTVSKDTYNVHDNEALDSMVLSGMTIKPADGDKVSSYRHSHKGHDEIYQFVRGSGEMQLNDDEPFTVRPGDIVLVREGTTHEVWNIGNEELYFIMIYQK
jgi:mannose-6-phosphate isomerase-like protein (cupin superfamily)